MIVITFSYILNTCEGKTAQRQTNDGQPNQFSRLGSVKSWVPNFEIKTVNWSLRQEEW